MDLSVAVRTITKSAEKAAYRDLDDNRLLEYLYDSYCRIIGKNETFNERVLSSEDDVENIYSAIASDLYDWYEARYSGRFGMNKGVRGAQGLRTISVANTYKNIRFSKKEGKETAYGRYGFSQLYAKKQFFSKFATTSFSEKGQPYMDFILHCCVAFFVSPKKVDQLLLYYGFPQLHIRNIHHMAIYTVLSSAQSMTAAEIESFNPFADIEKLYSKARDILNDVSADDAGSKKDYVIAGTKTNWIRDYLISSRLSINNMTQYISANKSMFTMRHSLILKDCWKYARLYTHIYYEYGHRNPDGSDWSNGEEKYSLYEFMTKYCLSESFPTPKRFNDILFREIERNQKHPSREFMIIIWLYNYCFASMSSLEISQYTVDKLCESYQAEIDDGVVRDSAGELAKVKANYSNGEFSISKFIFCNTASQPFHGAAVVASIQNKLNEYGLGPLNKNRVFDNYILSLESLEIRYDNNRQKNVVFWNRNRISEVASIHNVPDALVVITALFDEIQEAKQTQGLPYYHPLACRIYEQI